MEPLQPSKPAGISGMMPLTEEWFRKQKQLLQESKIETPDVDYPEDVANLTPLAAQELGKDKYDNFIDEVKQEILKLDPKSEDYLAQATSCMVWAALKQEYGDKITNNPGYDQMESIIVRKILNNTSHTETIQDFLGILTSEPQSETEQ